MISQISKALASGFTPKQVIDYILKKFPNESGRIKDAMAAGFTVDQVLKFISGGKKALANIETQPDEGSTEFQQTRNRDIGRREEVNKRAMQGAGLAATAIAAPMAASAASSALSRSLPQSLQRLVPELPNAIATSMSSQGKQPVPQQQGLPLESSNQTLPQQPPSNPVAASIPEPANLQQPELISNPKDYLEKKGVLQAVNESLKRGNNPEQVAVELGIKRSGNAKIDPELLKNIEEYAKTVPIQQEQPQLQEAEQLQESIEQPEKSTKSNKNELDLPFSDKAYRKLLSTQPNNSVGKLGDFIEDEKIKEILKPVLDVEIALVPKEHFKNSGGSGSYVSKDYGKAILLNYDDVLFGDPKEIYNTILHEATHALQDHKGRIDYLKKGSHYKGTVGVDEEATKQYKENIHEKSANKLADYGLKRHIEKNSVVSSPNGVGEVKEIRNGQAIVEVDGKLHKVKEEELEAPPIPEKELSTLFDDLMEGIEKETGEDVSRMVQWAGYNPEKNTLQFLPHTGDMYTYDNISEEDASLLTDILSTRKTTGSNFIGAWKKDSKSPIGAAMSKLIRKLQAERGGKGNEYSAKHGTIYSAYEPAIQAKKKKKK